MEPRLKVNHIRVEWFDCMILALNSQHKGTDTPSQRCPVVDEVVAGRTSSVPKKPVTYLQCLSFRTSEWSKPRV